MLKRSENYIIEHVTKKGIHIWFIFRTTLYTAVMLFINGAVISSQIVIPAVTIRDYALYEIILQQSNDV